MPRPQEGKQLFLVRLPNILSFQPRPFDPETFEEELEETEEGERRMRTDNVIRWRDGGEGTPRQSNARLARWSDGSMTLHVGNEVLTAQQIEHQKAQRSSTQLFLRHKGSNLECHGVLHKKLTFQPASIDSKTHRALTKHIAQAHTGKERKIKMTATTVNPEKEKLEKEKIWEDNNRLEARRQAHRDRDRGPELSADFLDADDDGELDGNLGAIRRNYKNRKRKAGVGGGGGGGAPRVGGVGGRKKARRRAGSDDEDEEDDDDDDEDEEEGEGDPAEMAGFIVDDEEAEDSDEEDD